MRIAYLTQSYPPMVSGAALIAEHIAKEMAARGHKVLVVAASDREEGYLTVENNLTVLRLRSVYNPMRVGQRFLLYPRNAILRSLRKFQPDVIHTHDPLQMGMLALKYTRHVNTPIALSIHQLPWFVSAYLPEIGGVRYATETVLWAYARWLLQQLNALITPTQTVTDIIRSKTGIKAKTIGYGIDLQTFHPHLSCEDETAFRSRLNLPPDLPVILYVGRLDVDKRVERVIWAAAQAMQTNEAHLLIVGDGRQKLALIKLCKSLGIADRCHFPGYVAVQGGLPEIYRMANLFVTASEIETQGIVLLEAAASGLPIVATRATCIPEIVHEGLNGYLAEPDDICALGQAISCLLEEPDRARQMGKAGRALVSEHNNQIIMDHYEKLYADLIVQSEVQHKALKIRSYLERAREWMNL